MLIEAFVKVDSDFGGSLRSVTDEFSSKRQKLLFVITTAAVVGLAVFAWGVWRIASEHAESTRWVEHTHEVLSHLDATVAEAETAETGQRGFLLTGREAYLNPYETALGEIRHELDAIGSLTRDNQTQQANLQRLRHYTAQKNEELAETIHLRREQGLQAALDLVLTDRGKLAMDEIRAVLETMRLEEERLLAIRRADSAKVSTLLYFLCSGILLVTCIAVATILWLLRWIRRLQTGLVTVCAWTRQVSYQGQWMSVEEYLRHRFGLSITHGMSEKAASELLREMEETASSRRAAPIAGVTDSPEKQARVP